MTWQTPADQPDHSNDATCCAGCKPWARGPVHTYMVPARVQCISQAEKGSHTIHLLKNIMPKLHAIPGWGKGHVCFLDQCKLSGHIRLPMNRRSLIALSCKVIEKHSCHYVIWVEALAGKQTGVLVVLSLSKSLYAYLSQSYHLVGNAGVGEPARTSQHC